MTTIFQKAVIVGFLFLVGGTAGHYATMKFTRPCPVTPDCNCPEPTVTVQPFEVEKIKGLREFVYSPEFTGSIQVAGVDSASVRRMLDESVDKAFQKYMYNYNKKRK